MFVQVKVKNADWDNVILPYLRQEDEASLASGPNSLYSAVGKPELQKAANALGAKFNEAAQKNILIEPYFKLIDAVYKKYSKTNGKDTENHEPPSISARQKKDAKLPLDEWRILAGFWEGFVNSGLSLTDKKKLDRMRQIDTKLQKLENDASQAVIDDKTVLWLTPQELDGVPADIMKALKKGNETNEGKLALPLQGPTQDTAASRLKNSTSRYRNSLAVANLAPSNVERLQSLIALRDERARILDWKNFAAYVSALSRPALCCS